MDSQNIRNFAKDLPNKPGIYKMISAEDIVLYVGKAKNLFNRVISYSGQVSERIKRMLYIAERIEIIICQSEWEALVLEANLIKKHFPKYNILLKDGKTFPYIKIESKHDFPQISKYRGKKLEDGEFFGPFASSSNVDITLLQILKVFKIRSCSDEYFASRKRPCLQYQIQRCSAPCVGKISKEDYRNSIKNVKEFLKGNNDLLHTTLQTQMNKLSENFEYERAAEVRDKIKALSHIQSNNIILKNFNADVIALYQERGECCIQIFIYRGGMNYGSRAYFPENTEDMEKEEVMSQFLSLFYQTNTLPAQIILSCAAIDQDMILSSFDKTKIYVPKIGDKAKLVEYAYENAKTALQLKIRRIVKNEDILENIRRLFNLGKDITRIEVYDNSHISGRHSVGAMIVATKSGFEKSEYRRYNIDNLRSDEQITGGDDYAMLKYVLTRRFNKIEVELKKNNSKNIPSLIIIDGGKGHLSTALSVLKNYSFNILIVAMSKGKDRNAGKEFFHLEGQEAFTLRSEDKIMKYLQLLRDEAHNHAISAHRAKRSKAIKYSSLDKVEGIGKVRKKALLEYFGSFDNILSASSNDLCKVKNISHKLAGQIYEQLHKT